MERAPSTPGRLARALMRVVSSKPGTWVFLNIIPHIDRPLLRLSRGRLSFAVGQPVLLLHTVGAKTGQARTTPLVFTRDGTDILIVASYGGGQRNPAWYYNLRATPRATLTVDGKTSAFTAHDLRDADREDAWEKALRTYPGYGVYAERAPHRHIPILRMTPDRTGE